MNEMKMKDGGAVSGDVLCILRVDESVVWKDG